MKGTACVAMGLVWLAIPAGTFQMGCSPDDDKCAANELPPHAVTLAPFEMLETEVTEAQYEAVTGVNPSCQEQFTAGPESPVECVPWHLAKEYCEALGGRLPTEAEWEYAARAGTTTRYYCGNDESCLDGIAWHGKNSGDKEHPVKGKAPNAWGLYDMLGNAFEWTSDWLAEDYYSFSPKGNPQGPDTGTMKVVRGGSWSVLQLELMRVSERHHGLGPPAVFTSDHVGFRCVR